MNCVSRNKAGERVLLTSASGTTRTSRARLLVNKPMDSYQDHAMGKCEACICGLYGQIKCGCKSAEEQGVSCSGVSGEGLALGKFLDINISATAAI